MLSEQTARQAAEGCGYRSLSLIRLGRTAVLKSRNQAVKVIPLAWRGRGQVAREHALMKWLREQGFPCPQQQGGIKETHGILVVAYELLETPKEIDWREFGELIGKLHELEPPKEIVGQSAALRAAGVHRQRIRKENLDLSPQEKELLLNQLEAGEKLISQGGEEKATLCHGDAHPGNLLKGPDGLVLADFEKAGMGPRQIDLASAMARAKRFGLGKDKLSEWVEGYGAGGEDRLVEGFQLISEVGGIVYLSGATDPQLKAEARKRVQSLSGGSGEYWEDR